MKSEKPYLEQTIIVYNPNYGDNRVCKCGHRYYRHFDGYENNAPVGCKYCGCRTFEEAALADRPLHLTKEDVEETEFLGIVHYDSGNMGVIFPFEFIEEVRKELRRLRVQLSEHSMEVPTIVETFDAICKEVQGS